MKGINKPARLWLVLGLALLLGLGNTVWAEQQAALTGGLSRVRVGNTVVEVEGGFIRSLKGNEVQVWLLGLSAQIKLYPWQKTATTSPQKLKFKLANLYPSRISLEGVESFQASDKGISFQLELAPGQNKRIKLKTLWDEPGFQFVVMGDNRDNPKIFQKVLRRANRHKPLFLVNCGDIVTNGTRAEYYQFLNFIQEADYPFFFALGNHDILRRGRKVFNELFGPAYYSFRFAGCHFIILDNSYARLSDTQYRWLSKELAANTDLRSFIFLHVPPFDPHPQRRYGMDLPLNTQWLFDLVAKYKVDTVFAAHIHSYGEIQKGKTNYIITGGAGAPLHGKNSFFHYVLVTVTPDEVKTEVIKVE